MSEKNKSKVKFTRNALPILQFGNLLHYNHNSKSYYSTVLVNGYKCISEQLVHKMYYM